MKHLLPCAALVLALAWNLPACAQSFSYTAVPDVKRAGPGDPKCAKPEWPRKSLRDEQQGTVTLSYLIGPDGAVLEGKIVRSSGFRELDYAAFEAIAKCRFTPPGSATEPVWMQMRYDWRLD